MDTHSQYSWDNRNIGNKRTLQHTHAHVVSCDPKTCCRKFFITAFCVFIYVCIFSGCLFFCVCLVTALDIPYRQPCLQCVLAQWPCFCLFERYNRSQNLKQKGEPVVWTMSDLFLQRFTKWVINIDNSSGKRDSWSEREAIPPCLN